MKVGAAAVPGGETSMRPQLSTWPRDNRANSDSDADHDRRGRPIDRTTRQKRLNLPSPHVARMPFAVKQGAPAHPLHVLRLRADAVILDTSSLTHLVEQFGTLPHRGV